MTLPMAPDWLHDGSPEPSSARAVLYLDTVDLTAVQVWHDAAEAALMPLVRPPGAPAFKRRVTGFTRPGDGRGGRMRARVWADAMVPDLDQVTTIWGYGDDEAYGPVDHVDVRVDRPGSEDAFLWLDLLAGLHEQAALPAVCEALFGVLRQVGAHTDPVYGEMLPNRVPRSPSTALDDLLRRHADVSVAEGRRFLRGYEWVTLCPSDLATGLGGAPAMRETGAFAEVVELGAGGLLLRATTDPADYTEAAARRVFEAVRPVLPPGQPRPMQYETITHVVMEDARS